VSALPDHLQRVTAARTEQAETKARAAITKLNRAKQPISFAAVSRAAGVSTDFLYRHPDLRAQIERHRSASGHGHRAQPDAGDATTSTSSAVRALARRLDEERASSRDTIAQLRAALEVAHGENLELRRRLATYEPD
jgi:hypothetical protein